MTAIKTYLLRLILCGLLVSLTGALPLGKRAGRVLRLCGGCLLLLTAVNPLLRVELSRLPDLMTGLTGAQRLEEAREKNDALLRELIQQQTVSWLTAQADELGISASFAVTLRPEEGSFVPELVELRGSWTPEQRAALSLRLEQELGIAPERQIWRSG